MIVAELAAKLGLVPDHHSFEQGHELVESLHHALEAYIGFEAVKKTGELVDSFVETAVAAKHLGERVGLSTEAVQELGYAASLSGSSAEGMQVSLQHLARGLQELKTKGTGPAGDALRALGIPLDALKGKNVDQTLELIANQIAKLPDGAQKTALAMELFGRSGTELIPLLNRGASGISELREEAEKLGYVIGDEGVEKAEEFERAQKKLHATLTGLKNSAVEALLPSLQKLIDKLQAWVEVNHDAIVSTLEKVIDGLGEAFSALGDVIDGLSSLWRDHQDVVLAVIEALGVAITAFSVVAAVTWAAPILVATAVIAALILLVENFGAIWGAVSGFVADKWEWVTGKGQDFADWFASLPGQVLDWVTDIGETIKKAFQDAWDYVVDGAQQAWKDIEDVPVIGHLIRATEAVGNFVAGNGPSSFATSPTQLLGGPGGNVTNQVQFGDVHVQVDANNVDENQIGDLIGEKVLEKHDEALRHAFAVLGGARS